MKVKLTSKGQLTLPKEFRDKLSLDSGSYLNVTVENGKIIMEPQKQENDISYIYEYAAGYGAKSKKLEEVRGLTSKLEVNIQDYIRKARDEEANDL